MKQVRPCDAMRPWHAERQSDPLESESGVRHLGLHGSGILRSAVAAAMATVLVVSIAWAIAAFFTDCDRFGRLLDSATAILRLQ